MNNDLRPINTLPNFKRFCMTIGELPTSYLETMTYYEMLVWFTEYMKNTIIPTINNNGLAVQELQDKYIELKSYVDNYFNNLDVQEEINNKLDKMVQDGTLQEIITSYLNSKAVFGFDNVESMKNSTNLINGSYAKTLGYYSINDDGGATYKIRNITNEDIVNDQTIIALSDNNLIAELIYEELNVKQLGCKGDGTTDDTAKLKNIFENLAKNGDTIYFPKGTYLYNQQITCDKTVRVIGSGYTPIYYDNCVIKNNGNSGLIFTNKSTVIKDIDFIGNESQTCFGLQILGIRANIINCCFRHFDNNIGLIIGDENTYYNTDIFLIQNVVINFCDIGCKMGSAVYNDTNLVDNNAGTISNLTISSCRIGLYFKNSNNNNFLSLEIDGCSECGIDFINSSYNYILNPYLENQKNINFDETSIHNKVIGSRGAGWIAQNYGNVNNNQIMGNSQGKGIYDLYQYLNTQKMTVANNDANGYFDITHDAHTLNVKHSQSSGQIDLTNTTNPQTTLVNYLKINSDSTNQITGLISKVWSVTDKTIPANGTYGFDITETKLTLSNNNQHMAWIANINFTQDLDDKIIPHVQCRNGKFRVVLQNTSNSDITITSNLVILALKTYFTN